MKKIFLTSLIIFLSIGFTYAQDDNVITTAEIEVVDEIVEPVIEINWESSYDEALKKAKNENKPLLIYFTGSDWCGPCKIVDKKLFHTEKFKDYSNENLVLYMADFPRNKNLIDAKSRDTNEKLSVRYGQSKYPTMVMVNGKGNVLGSKKGMYMIEYYYPFFDGILNNNYK